MSEKLTKRQVRSIKKLMEHKELRAQQGPARVEGRAARSRKPPRRRDWDEAHDETPSAEKMRRATERVAAQPGAAAAPELPPETAGTVIEIRSGDSLVSFQGRVVRAMLPPSARLVVPGTRSPLAVGDRVQLAAAGPGEARIVAIAERTSALTRGAFDASRRDPAHQAQVLAANVDRVVIVCTPSEPPFRPRLLDRYLVAASRDGLPALVCLNKTDLGVEDDVERSLAGYEALGVAVARTSAATGDGVDALRARIAGGTSIFAGHSGVGKSSLLNALEPGLALKVGTVTESTAGQGKGRHTTSSARLVPLSTPETFVVDTPGIRSFGLGGLTKAELGRHFPEIAALAPGCAYRDCLHAAEPGCAVRGAAHEDEFLGERVGSYRAMLAELS